MFAAPLIQTWAYAENITCRLHVHRPSEPWSCRSTPPAARGSLSWGRYTVRIWNKYIQYICSSYYLNPELHEPKFLLPPQDKSRTWGVKQISCLINLGVIGWVILGRQEKTSQHLHRNLRILGWYGFTSQYHIFQVVCECQACGRPCNISLHSQVFTSYFSNIYMYKCMMLFLPLFIFHRISVLLSNATFLGSPVLRH